MRYGMNLPQFAHFGDVRTLVDMAQDAEKAGWDGFFIWDHILFDPTWHPMVDPWVALSAIALSTQRIRIGTLVTPLPRRRPWKLARETVSIDRLSNGRLILGVGIGDPVQWEFGFFGEQTDAKIRAQKLDEGLDVLTGLWSGDMFSYRGEQYQLEAMKFVPTPVQSPRIPIWVAGWWPNKPPARRAARWDGFVPGSQKPEAWREILGYIKQHRSSDAPFDAVNTGVTPGDDPAKARGIVAPYADAGVTWWIEDISPYAYGQSWEHPWREEITVKLRERIRQGPPRI